MNFHKMEVDTDGTLQLLVFFLIIIISIGLISFFSILVRDAVVQRLVKWTWVGRGGGERKGVLFLTLVQTGIVDWNL